MGEGRAEGVEGVCGIVEPRWAGALPNAARSAPPGEISAPRPRATPAQVTLRPGRNPGPPGPALSPLCRLRSPLRLKYLRRQRLLRAPSPRRTSRAVRRGAGDSISRVNACSSSRRCHCLSIGIDAHGGAHAWCARLLPSKRANGQIMWQGRRPLVNALSSFMYADVCMHLQWIYSLFVW